MKYVLSFWLTVGTQGVQVDPNLYDTMQQCSQAAVQLSTTQPVKGYACNVQSIPSGSANPPAKRE